MKKRLVFIVSIFLCFSPAFAADLSLDEQAEFKNKSFAFVKKYIKYEHDAIFNSDTTITEGMTLKPPFEEEKLWSIKGTVKCKNALGAMLTEEYEVQLFKKGNTVFHVFTKVGDFIDVDSMISAAVSVDTEIHTGLMLISRMKNRTLWTTNKRTINGKIASYTPGKIVVKESKSGKDISIPVALLNEECAVDASTYLRVNKIPIDRSVTAIKGKSKIQGTIDFCQNGIICFVDKKTKKEYNLHQIRKYLPEQEFRKLLPLIEIVNSNKGNQVTDAALEEANKKDFVNPSGITKKS